MRTDLERFFNPQSIAIVGASRDFATISGQPLKHLQSHGYRGRLYPVNPRYPEVAGVQCYPSLAELPETPDLVLILVNASRVAGILEECGGKGVPYAIVFSSGFAETGGAGREMQARLVEIARRYGIGVIGPNCQGMINVADSVFAGFGSVFSASYEPGAVSMASQSGGFGFSVMNLASNDGGLGFRQIVTTGNESGVSILEFMDYFIRDPGTGIIAGYLEGAKDAHRLPEIGQKALAAGKPILMWKSGNTEQGRRAAAAHTANPGGSVALYQAAFRQNGIIQVEDIQDVVDYGRAFRCGRLPRGNRLAIITISGGAGILMTDECVARGMQLAQLAPETVAGLREFVPSFGSLLNPVDVTAGIFNDLTLINRALQAIIDDPGVDCVAMINASLQGEIAARIAAEIVAIAKKTDKPIFLTCSARDVMASEAYATLDAARVPHYKSPVRCGRAMAAVSWYAEAKRRNEARRADKPLVLHRPAAIQALADRRSDLTEHHARRILEQYGIPVTREESATNGDGGIETILGISNDPLFGPAVRFGLGGIYTEVLKDVSFRLVPVAPSVAREMVEEIAGYAVLTGSRGRPPADVDALVDAIVRLSALAIDLKDYIAELEVDPLLVFSKGRGVMAVSALIRTKDGRCPGDGYK